MNENDALGLTRRELLGAAAAGAVAIGAAPLLAAEEAPEAALSRLTSKLQYLTPMDRFGGFVREKPPAYELPPEKLREVGLTRETWKLEVMPEEGGDAKVERPMTRAAGTALDFDALMRLAEKHAVRFIKTLTCTNANEPFGTGLWEGVPLREAVWMTRPTANVRRVYYYGYHNDDAKQRFQSSLTMARVLEDPPGELPVILAYKYNGQWLSTRLGGPVRMIVPGAYANKSVKWLQRIVLSNSYQANDTYALWNNDVESPMKSYARLLNPPAKAKAGIAIPLVGLAQVGLSGLSKVQYALHPEGTPLPADDPYLGKLDWRDAQILPPPADWAGGLPDGKLPATPLQFEESGKPRQWPLRYAIAHWSALAAPLAAGKYTLRCRAIDGNGVAQPLPRPLPKSGNNAIQAAPLVVEA